MKSSFIDISDHFCGCGGNGQAAEAAGFEVVEAANHWKLATETYKTNFPKASVRLADITNSDPRNFMSTRVAVMSPECTTHSPAGGNTHKAHKKQLDLYEKQVIDPATERSRMTMWDVVRFSEYHRYEAVVIENVVEAKTRWPLFDTWLLAMHHLGYNHQLLFLNSQHFEPCPQSRDRMYVVFSLKKIQLPKMEYMPTAYCKRCAKDVSSYQWWKSPNKKYGKYGKYGQYMYRCTQCTEIVEPYYHAGFNIIDWTIPGKPVLNRKKPLVEKTIRRIEYGLSTYGREPYTITLSNSSILPSSAVRSLADPFRTLTTCDSDAFVMPYIVENNGCSTARSITAPFPTITTEPKHGVVSPENIQAFFTYYNGKSKASELIAPAGTITTVDRIGLVNYTKPTLEECTYRTIRPHEAKKAMAFRDDYVILGDAKKQVKQLGNAVTPPVMTWILSQVAKYLK